MTPVHKEYSMTIILFIKMRLIKMHFFRHFITKMIYFNYLNLISFSTSSPLSAFNTVNSPSPVSFPTRLPAEL